MPPLHALIVDDNTLNSDVLVTLLENAGLTTTSLESPRNLSALLDEASQVNVVFLDLEFPHHNGFELIGDLKRHPRLQGVPIVAYSVHTSEIDEARAVGFHSFLGKPLDAQRFPDQLHRILNGIQVWEI